MINRPTNDDIIDLMIDAMAELETTENTLRKLRERLVDISSESLNPKG